MVSRSISGAIIVAGVVGALVCITAVAGGWSVRVRVQRTVDRVSTRAINAVEKSQSRLTEFRDNLAALRPDIEGLEQRLKRRIASEVVLPESERRELQARVAATLTDVSGQLDRAQQILAISDTGIQLVEQVSEVANPVADQDQSDRAAAALTKLHATQDVLSELTELANNLRQRCQDESGKLLTGEDWKQFVPVLAVLLQTSDRVQERIDEFAEALAETETDIEALQQRTQRSIDLATAAIIVALVWMLAGQLALVTVGVQRWKRPQN